MKKIHVELLALFNTVRILTYAVARYNPGIEADDKESLPALAATMGTLSYGFNKLRINTLAAHDARRRKEYLEGGREE